MSGINPAFEVVFKYCFENDKLRELKLICRDFKKYVDDIMEWRMDRSKLVFLSSFNRIFKYLEDYDKSHRLAFTCTTLKKYVDNYTIERFKVVKENLLDVAYYCNDIETICEIIKYDDPVILKYMLRCFRMRIGDVAGRIFREAMKPKSFSINIMKYASAYIKPEHISKIIKTLLGGVPRHVEVIKLITTMLSKFSNSGDGKRVFYCVLQEELHCVGIELPMEKPTARNIKLRSDDIRIPTVEYLKSMSKPKTVRKSINISKGINFLLRPRDIQEKQSPQKHIKSKHENPKHKELYADEQRYYHRVMKYATRNFASSTFTYTEIMLMCLVTTIGDTDEPNNISRVEDHDSRMVDLYISAAIISGNIAMMDIVKSRGYRYSDRYRYINLSRNKIGYLKITSPRMYNDIKFLFPNRYMEYVDVKRCSSSIAMELINDDLQSSANHNLQSRKISKVRSREVSSEDSKDGLQSGAKKPRRS
jgi:hypothetical protein